MASDVGVVEGAGVTDLDVESLRNQRLESLGTLAGGIAHDLNNVLSPILMAVDLLESRVTDDKGRALLATIGSSARRGAALVSQILAFGRGARERTVLDLARVVRDVEKMAADTFPRTIRIVTELSARARGVVGDDTQIHQVLLNLCVNARDAMPEGGVLKMTLGAAVVDESWSGPADTPPGAYVVLAVEDTGTGIPPAVREKIFDPFFTTKDVGKGTGLGLSTTLGIVRSHGGFIRVDSEAGRGTTFRVYLPAASGEAPAAARPAPAADLRRGCGELILVVDDEESIRAIAKATLEAGGYRACTAGDGAEALSLFVAARGEVSVVLVDVKMPVMDGVAMIRALRQIDPGVRIVAMSGNLEPEAFKTMGAGATLHFLQKPYRSEQLLETIQRITG